MAEQLRVTMRRWTRPLLLTGAMLVGGGVVVLWPWVRQRLTPPASEGPPVLSIARAQEEVPFPIYVPTELPADGRVTGVVVNRVQEVSRARGSGRRTDPDAIRRIQRTRHGYGIAIGSLEGRLMVFAGRETPAARAGMPVGTLFTLLAVDGKDVRSITKGAATGSAEAAVTSATRHAPPLRLTVRDSWGRVRTYLLAEQGPYLYPETPTAPRPRKHHKQAAVLMQVRGRQCVLIESEVNDDEEPAMSIGAAGARRVDVAGQEVWFSGAPDAPGAVWLKGDRVHFWLNNHGKAISQEEAVRLIRSLRPYGEG
ncbi:MAG: hypothetical protein IT208_18865 [Chthonomonadales bacterium]|nr:hypothetical protein [Chthonomonadales bacterium]